MLAHEYEHGIIEHMHILERCLVGALTFIMNNVGWHKPILPSALEQTIGQVDILAIHKVVLIQDSHFVESLASYEETGSAHYLNA